MKKDVAEKSDVMKRQRQLLSDRYDFSCKTEEGMTMTNGKPQPIGPTVKLPSGMTWDQLGQISAHDIKKKQAFPPGFDRFPHVKQAVGGQVFPQVQIKEFPRLERFDVEFDLPECLLPEFPPPIFLTTIPNSAMSLRVRCSTPRTSTGSSGDSSHPLSWMDSACS